MVLVIFGESLWSFGLFLRCAGQLARAQTCHWRCEKLQLLPTVLKKIGLFTLDVNLVQTEACQLFVSNPLMKVDCKHYGSCDKSRC